MMRKGASEQTAGTSRATALAATIVAASWFGSTPERASGADGLPVPMMAAWVTSGHAADTIWTERGSLEEASVEFARALASVSTDRMSALLVSDGIRLHLGGPGHAGLSSRQALATLRAFLRRYEQNEAFVARAAPVEGSPDRGFAELSWGARIPGTSQAVSHSLFVGFSRESGTWQVDEVRLLR